jgi:uncharacterized protein YndB with AHSA1/START domain
MRHYTATTTINASPETVWKIITDAARYPEWDPAMDRIEGRLALGETVKFYTKLSTQAFPVKVTAVIPVRKLVLTGGMPLGLFKSQRTHTLVLAPDGATIFTTEETFSGLLLPIFGRTIPDLTENFQGFVAALKQHAEAQHR